MGTRGGKFGMDGIVGIPTSACLCLRIPRACRGMRVVVASTSKGTLRGFKNAFASPRRKICRVGLRFRRASAGRVRIRIVSVSRDAGSGLTVITRVATSLGWAVIVLHGGVVSFQKVAK